MSKLVSPGYSGFGRLLRQRRKENKERDLRVRVLSWLYLRISKTHFEYKKVIVARLLPGQWRLGAVLRRLVEGTWAIGMFLDSSSVREIYVIVRLFSTKDIAPFS